MEEIETVNDQCVGVQGDSIMVMMPKQKMTKEQALRQAAWLVALADDSGDEFQKVLDAVLNT